GLERLRAFLIEALLERGPQCRVRRSLTQIPTIEQGAEVEAGPALEHGEPAAGGDLRDRRQCHPLVVRGRKRLVGIDHVDGVAGKTPELSRRWFVGANV